MLFVHVLINWSYYKLYQVAIRYSHEMYEHFFEISKSKGSKFFVIGFLVGFYLQIMNIYVRLGLHIDDFFVIYVIIF